MIVLKWIGIVLGSLLCVAIGLALLPFVLLVVICFGIAWLRASLILADSRLKGPIGHYGDDGGFYPINNPNYPNQWR